MSANLSHCARCKGRTETVWRHGEAFCSVCGSSHSEMAAAGLNTAGPWHDCPFCQERRYYAQEGEVLRCEKCHLTQVEAELKDAERPRMIRFRPERVTSGALIEIQYWSGRPLQPTLLMISWLPQHGTTTVRLDPSQEREGANLYSVSVEVPHGATRAVVTDRTGSSKRCEIPIDYVSQPGAPVRKKWWQLFIGR